MIYHSDQPSIEQIPLENVNENSTVILRRDIHSNPLSNVSWYRGTELLRTQTFVRTATYNIEMAKCTDTHNFTLLANNGIEGSVSVLVELIVNCKFFLIKRFVTCTVVALLETFNLNYNNSKHLVNT